MTRGRHSHVGDPHRVVHVARGVDRHRHGIRVGGIDPVEVQHLLEVAEQPLGGPPVWVEAQRIRRQDALEFIRRFLQQVLPARFMKFRYCGFTNDNSAIPQDRLSALIGNAGLRFVSSAGRFSRRGQAPSFVCWGIYNRR